jgi:hypothetical protein
MFRRCAALTASLLLGLFAAPTTNVASLIAQGPAVRLDAPALVKTIESLLKEQGDDIVTNLWLGGDSGKPWFVFNADEPAATASAIKTFYLVELFASYREALDKPLPGADAVLQDDGHPAISHFSPEQRAEIRRGLGGASVRRIARVMMGSAAASNTVYNAAANIATALLGGPEVLTRLIRERDPVFAGVTVRRYMLRDIESGRSNDAPAAALAVLYQQLAARALTGVDNDTMQAIRDAIIKVDIDGVGTHYSKGGSLAVDPATEVRAGWLETARGPLIYVVMTRLAGRNEPSSQRRLSRTAEALTSLLAEAGYAAMR